MAKEHSLTLIGRHIPRAAQIPGVWAGGTTLAIFAEPQEEALSAAGARLWVGTAVIDRAAPYSFFPGRVRLQIPLHGNGIRLSFQDPPEVVTLLTLDQHRFDGGRPVLVELNDGPVTALNLIVTSENDVAAQIIHATDTPGQTDWPVLGEQSGFTVVRLIYVVHGDIVVNFKDSERRTLTLCSDETFVFHPERGDQPSPAISLVAHGTAQAVVVLATLGLAPELPV